MIKINPEDYDYLWTDHDIDFIFTSCYLSKEFRNADIVLIYSWKEKGLKFFLSKKDRTKFSEYGVKLYEKGFSEWKNKIIKDIKNGEHLIEETRKYKNRVSLMSNKEIKDKILDRADLFQSLSGSYFYTEFFFLDKAEKLIKRPQYKAMKNNLKEMGKLKFKARNVLNKFYDYDEIFRTYLEEVSRRIKREDIRWLSYKEVADLLDGKDVDISKRGLMDWVLARKSKWKLITGKTANRIILGFENNFFSKNVSIIKGTIANRGEYKGKVRIIRTLFSNRMEEEIKKVKKGDVLVAETTGPEMTAACKRAGAIVTDEGGLTSHAAIISRELGIPCIVGAKIATRVLKDGDIIIVNANKGIINKLKD
ncbi:MAG: PEP-utilizing enzyme [Candidatus Woesearchaeota archaeon]|nr:PEP-utilizing enzyme [Candidatus Woesearchaeota archaeon]